MLNALFSNVNLQFASSVNAHIFTYIKLVRWETIYNSGMSDRQRERERVCVCEGNK